MKVLIVDDEASVHEQMKNVIPWEALGWTIIGHAVNGEEACRLAASLRPQLILTDIKMPLMDGLSFMEWLKQSDIHAEVIVLSGYGDFEYSRPAFLHGAFDYLLKPLNEADLLQILSKAVEKIRKDSNAKVVQINEKAVLQNGLTVLQDEFLTSTADASEADENELIVQAAELSVLLPESGFYAVVVKLFDFDERVNERYGGDRNVFYFAARNIIKETIDYYSPSVVFRHLSKSNEFIILFNSPMRNDDKLQSLVNKLHRSLVHFMRVNVKLGLSSFKNRISKLPEAYREGAHAIESMLLSEQESVGTFSRGEKTLQSTSSSLSQMSVWKEITLLFDLLLEYGTLRDGEQLKIKLEEAFGENNLSKISGFELKLAISAILDKIELKAKNRDIALMVGEGKSKLSELKIQQMKALLQRMVTYMLDLSFSETRTKSGKQLIEVIRKYVQEQYRTVNLEHISQTFFINKNYFCSLFKSVTGESFMDYLTAVRIDQAKRLLLESELKAYEIAEQVGYKDQRYFSQVFKKATGVQPTQYRQQTTDRT